MVVGHAGAAEYYALVVVWLQGHAIGQGNGFFWRVGSGIDLYGSGIWQGRGSGLCYGGKVLPATSHVDGASAGSGLAYCTHVCAARGSVNTGRVFCQAKVASTGVRKAWSHGNIVAAGLAGSFLGVVVIKWILAVGRVIVVVVASYRGGAGTVDLDRVFLCINYVVGKVQGIGSKGRATEVHPALEGVASQGAGKGSASVPG